jgi:hypothetical protein
MLPRTIASFVADIAMMWRRTALVVSIGLSCGVAAAPVAAPDPKVAPDTTAAAVAPSVPLPRPRPAAIAAPSADWSEPHSFGEAAGPDFDAADVTSEPSPCRLRLEKFAEVEPMPRLIGPGACGGSDMVEIEAVQARDGGRIAIKPPALLACGMAETVAMWLREDAAPQVAALGSTLSAIENYGSYECRSRNRLPGAKLSEHAHGEALDVRALHLADGRRLVLVDTHVDKPLRDALRDSACRRFTTVLGPGADIFHVGHVHLDVIQRHNGYRICQWDVREPPPAPLPPKPPETETSEAKTSEAKPPETKPEAKPESKPESKPEPPQEAVKETAKEQPEPSETAAVPAAAPRFAEGTVPLPRARPKVMEKPHHRRKTRRHFHFPFSFFR